MCKTKTRVFLQGGALLLAGCVSAAAHAQASGPQAGNGASAQFRR